MLARTVDKGMTTHSSVTTIRRLDFLNLDLNNKEPNKMDKKIDKLALVSVMLCFFAMGFVDLVGIASNYVKKDLGLNDATANVFPSLVFFWFLIFSVPTGMLMNKIGRKKTVSRCCSPSSAKASP